MTRPEGAPGGEAPWGGSWAGSVVSGAGWAADEGQRDAGAEPPSADGRVGRYRIDGELGRGGMGQVLAARDQLLGRTVALKRLLPGGRPDAAARLAREARITGLLEHPGIVPVLDAGHDDAGEPFYVMRLVRGRTLAQAAAEADLDGRLRLLRHVLGACEAVAFAHEIGVVHRDLKPANILVGEFGETQVADWGLARELGEPEEASADVADTALPEGLTRVGAVLGTPGFMSPEQARGEPAGKASDVFGLGVVLWSVLAGRPPTPSDQVPDVPQSPESIHLRQKWTLGAPTLEPLPESVPAELGAIVARATAQAPGARYVDAKDLADDLSRFLDGQRVRAHDYTTAQLLGRLVRAWRAPLAVAAVALMLLAVGGLEATRRTIAERDRATEAAAVARKARGEADRSLNAALTRHATSAATLGRRDLAETLAVEALVRSPSPTARGVLAAFAAAPRPSRLTTMPLPPCRRVHLGETTVLCIDQRSVSLHERTPGGLRRRWQVARIVPDAALFEREGVVALPMNPVVLLSLKDGTARLGGPLAYITAQVSDPPVDGLAVAWSATMAVALRADGQRGPRPMQRCGRGDLISAASWRNGRLALFCGGQRLLYGNLHTRPMQAMPFDTRPHDGATAALWLPGEATVLVGARDGTLHEVDVRRSRSREVARLSGGQLDLLVPQPKGPLVAVVPERGGVLIWHVPGRSVVAHLPGEAVRAVRWHGRTLEVAGRTLTRWRLPERPCATRLWSRPDHPGLGSAALSPDGGAVAVAPGSGELQVLDACTGAVRGRDHYARGVLKGARWTPDGGLLAWSASPPSLRRYRWPGLDAGPPRGHQGVKRALALADGRVVFAPYSDWVWQAASSPDGRLGDVRPIPMADPAYEMQVFIDSDGPTDGRWALFLGQRGDLVQVDSGARTARHVSGPAKANRLAVAGDGGRVALATGGAVSIWSWPPGRRLRRIALPERTSYGLALDGPGALLAVGDRGGVVHVWRTSDGALIARLEGHDRRVADVRFGGGRLLSASWDGSTRLWDVATLTAPAAELHQTVRAAWQLELDDALSRLR